MRRFSRVGRLHYSEDTAAQDTAGDPFDLLEIVLGLLLEIIAASKNAATTPCVMAQRSSETTIDDQRREDEPAASIVYHLAVLKFKY